MSRAILIVDDNEILNQVLARVLSRMGYTVIRASTAAEALELAFEHRLDLAILDLRLPDGNGLQLGKDLHEQMPELPMLLMTAYPLSLRENPDGLSCFTQVLTKPVSLAALRLAIHEALAQGRPALVGGP